MADQGKSESAFRTISEVSEDLSVPQHVLRFWETKFSAVKPLKRGGNRRYYRPEDIQLLRAINALLYVDGYTIRGVQKLLRDQGVRTIAAAKGGPLGASTAPPEAPFEFAAPVAPEPTRPAAAPAKTATLDQMPINQPQLEFEPDPTTVNVGLFPLPAKPVAPAAAVRMAAAAPAVVVAAPVQQPEPVIAAVAEPAPEPAMVPPAAIDHRDLVLSAIARLEDVRTRIKAALAGETAAS